MSLFTGQHERLLDDDGTVAIPPAYRRAIAAEGDGVYAVLGPGAGLWIYTRERFEAILGELGKRRDHTWALRHVLGTARLLRMDRRGRIYLPAKLAALGGLSRQITVVGVGDHIEIWPRALWASHEAELLDRLRSGGMLAP